MNTPAPAKSAHLSADEKRLVCQFMIKHKFELERGGTTLSVVRQRLGAEFGIRMSAPRLRYWCLRCGIRPSQPDNGKVVYYGKPPRIIVEALCVLLESSQSLPQSTIDAYLKALRRVKTYTTTTPQSEV